MNVCIRADSSLSIGAGHIMRCLSLAEALQKNGAQVSFSGLELEGNKFSLVEGYGYSIHRLSKAANDPCELKHILMKEEKTIDWLVIDHYGISSAYEKTMRSAAKKIMVIDDLADRMHDCDLILDQNRMADTNAYDSFVPKSCVKLMGPKYALLRRQFVEVRAKKNVSFDPVKRLLVLMGGTDHLNLTSRVLRALQSFHLRGVAVDVVISSANPYRKEVERLASTLSDTRCLYDVADMAELMLAADLCIGSAGSASWERCCTGLPAALIIAAENQIAVAEKLESEGVALNLGWHEEVTEYDIVSAVRMLVADDSRRESMTLRGMGIVDGRGAERVAQLMMKMSDEGL